jgi:hypothetical protein
MAELRQSRFRMRNVATNKEGHFIKGKVLTYQKHRCSFSRAVITKFHRQDGFNNRNLFSHSPGVSNFNTKLSTGFTPKTSYLGLWMDTFSLCFGMVFLLFACDLIFSCKDLSHIRWEPILKNSF